MVLIVFEKPPGIRTSVTLADDKSQGIRIAMLMVCEKPPGIRKAATLVDGKSQGNKY